MEALKEVGKLLVVIAAALATANIATPPEFKQPEPSMKKFRVTWSSFSKGFRKLTVEAADAAAALTIAKDHLSKEKEDFFFLIRSVELLPPGRVVEG